MRVQRGIVVVLLGLLVLAAGRGDPSVSELDAKVAMYRWGVAGWEVKNFLDKWRYRIREALPWHRAPAEDTKVLEELFHGSQRITELERRLVTGDGGEGVFEQTRMEIADQLDELRGRQTRIRAQAEERLEGQVSAVLDEEGFQSRIGLIWPPVDVSLVNPPRALVISPRDVIERRRTINLRPNLKLGEIESLEEEIFRELGLSALVVNIGGIATYPSIVPPRLGMRGTLEVTAHEWLHQYWFFRPLGRNYWSDGDTMTLNETAASMAGKELGARAYELVTGEALPEPMAVPAPAQVAAESAFDFQEEMRETRLEADRLLAQGLVEEAEQYMEERRKLFVANGLFIRKLNQAYFAFFGTYAANPASVSPIQGELERFRATVDGTGEFIRAMSGFSSYGEFKRALEEVGE